LYMNKLLKNIRAELLGNIDKDYRESSKNFFKEEVNLLGVRAPVVRKISKESFKEVKDLSKAEIFELVEELLSRATCEETLIAFDWAYKLKREYKVSDFEIFEQWLKKYVSNWGACDEFCTHAFGALINKYPELVSKTVPWRKSSNRWLRRASAVILIHPWTKPNPFLKEILETADTLLLDEDDLVQKGYGWMLKVAGDHYPKKVFEFVLARKNNMPRTALRYAIEKMPKEWKKKAMVK